MNFVQIQTLLLGWAQVQ